MGGRGKRQVPLVDSENGGALRRTPGTRLRAILSSQGARVFTLRLYKSLVGGCSQGAVSSLEP